jgi:hypothetical protein
MRTDSIGESGEGERYSALRAAEFYVASISVHWPTLAPRQAIHFRVHSKILMLAIAHFFRAPFFAASAALFIAFPILLPIR